MHLSAPEPGVWAESFRIHSYEVDFKRNATIETLCRLLQEAAWNHAETLGAGFSHLAAQGRFWVLSRFALEVASAPRWNDHVVVHTWPRAAKSIFAFRDFELWDAAGRHLCAASSAWLVLDSRTRKPVRTDKWLATIPALPDKRALADDPPKLSSLEVQTSPVAIPVKYSDIDVNGHVNNSRYIGILLDSYSVEFHAAHHLSRLDINFLGEARSGDTLELRTTEAGPHTFHHTLAKAANAEEVCRAVIAWKALAGSD